MPTLPFPPEENKEIFCNWCYTNTLHEIKGNSSREYHDKTGVIEALDFRLYICASCGRGILEEIYTNVKMVENDEEDEEFPPYEYEYYPSRNGRQEKRFQSIPAKLAYIYNETIQAYNNKTIILCAIGIRALLEGICADKGIKGRNLEDKINRLVFYLQEKYVQNLHSIRFLGNEAAHELEIPQWDELKLAIDICEKLLDYLYELDSKTSQLTEMMEKRKIIK